MADCVVQPLDTNRKAKLMAHCILQWSDYIFTLAQTSLIGMHPHRTRAQNHNCQQHCDDPVQGKPTNRDFELRPIKHWHGKQRLAKSAFKRVNRKNFGVSTARKVPGRNTVVNNASAFIAAPSLIPAAAIRRLDMASRVVM